ncbi:hypothetical protein PR048_013608 [Dryococelus australis]|uniref:Uncharacterized protein n=1 Tax=Dryococelus australis TaxID=614101 RepID=A0ABQ9HU65_9NEOP|nr:hypothetical protein PR048_013608 [Dryococelus australis]
MLTTFSSDILTQTKTRAAHKNFNVWKLRRAASCERQAVPLQSTLARHANNAKDPESKAISEIDCCDIICCKTFPVNEGVASNRPAVIGNVFPIHRTAWNVAPSDFHMLGKMKKLLQVDNCHIAHYVDRLDNTVQCYREQRIREDNIPIPPSSMRDNPCQSKHEVYHGFVVIVPYHFHFTITSPMVGLSNLRKVEITPTDCLLMWHPITTPCSMSLSSLALPSLRLSQTAWDLATREILAGTVGTHTRSRAIHLSVRHNDVCREDTNFRETISPEERLVVALSPLMKTTLLLTSFLLVVRRKREHAANLAGSCSIPAFASKHAENFHPGIVVGICWILNLKEKKLGKWLSRNIKQELDGS